VRAERAARPAPAKAPARKRPAPAKQRPARKPKPQRSQEDLEREIGAAEAALRTVEDELSDPEAWAGAEAAARSTARHEQAQRAVEQLYEQLERVTS
jgi:predicted  nucleic acid-binding Zn-ribbon protein